MFCNFCGKEIQDGATFCQYCGRSLTNEAPNTAQPQAAPVNLATGGNFASNLMLNLVKDVLFLVVCILVSASVLFSLIGNLMNGEGGIISFVIFNAFPVLFGVFLWILYAKGLQNNTVDASSLHTMTGITFAGQIACYVTAGFATLGLLLIVAAADFIDDLVGGMAGTLIDGFDDLVGLAILFMLIIIAGFILTGIFGARAICDFSKSLYAGVTQGAPIVKASVTMKWLLGIGIAFGLFALLNVTAVLTFLSVGCLSGAFVVVFVLMNKYFKNV